MPGYELVNLIALFPLLLVGAILWRRRKLSRTLKISMVAPLLSFPWLYFGITRKAWAHGDPGPLFMAVPLNEVVLSFIMTFLNAGIWILNYSVIIDEADRCTKSKNSAAQQEEDNPV